MARARGSGGKRGRRHHENLGDSERSCRGRKGPEAFSGYDFRHEDKYTALVVSVEFSVYIVNCQL